MALERQGPLKPHGFVESLQFGDLHHDPPGAKTADSSVRPPHAGKQECREQTADLVKQGKLPPMHITEQPPKPKEATKAPEQHPKAPEQPQRPEHPERHERPHHHRRHHRRHHGHHHHRHHHHHHRHHHFRHHHKHHHPHPSPEITVDDGLITIEETIRPEAHGDNR